VRSFSDRYKNHAEQENPHQRTAREAHTRVSGSMPSRPRPGRPKETVIPNSSPSNRDRAGILALWRLRTIEDCAKVVEFLATDLSDYVTGAVIPIDGGLVRG
jgi:NAD(P)-dependent dehydrogenase (short-subunit alcohol dehydrogenase family)